MNKIIQFVNGGYRFRALSTLLLAVLILVGVDGLLPARLDAHAEADAQTYRVATTGVDNSGCGPSSSPCKTIQYAVNKAVSGDTILVAAGTYTYSSPNDTCSFLTTRAVTCFVDKHLTILGGYSTSNWNLPDPVSNSTIIDGGNSRRGVAVISYNTDASLLMEGFTIRNGLAQGASSGGDFYTYAFGGGMWAQNSSVTLRDMKFLNNRAVGGNTATQYGGAGSGGGLAIQSPAGGAGSLLERVVFEGNQAVGGTGNQRGGVAIGGGLYTYAAPVAGHHLDFINNLAQAGSSSGSGLDSTQNLRADALGGGAGFQIGSNPTLADVYASGNQAIGGNAGTGSSAVGGGGFGGAISIEKSVFEIRRASLVDNIAKGGRGTSGGVAFGGALISDSCNTTIDQVLALRNTALSGSTSNGGNAGAPNGGGMYLTAFHGTGYVSRVTNTLVADNRIEAGGGINIGGGGAGIVVQAIQADLLHVTLARNIFGSGLQIGQALLVHGLYGNSGTPAVANVQYSIISDHLQPATEWTSALTVASGSTVNMNNLLFAGNTNDINTNGKPYAPGVISGLQTAIHADTVAYISPGSPEYNYHLRADSPAIDLAAGSTTITDIDGQSRPSSSYADLGADEFAVVAVVASTSDVSAVADNRGFTSMVSVDIPADPNADWTATTSANWVNLGQSNLHHFSGQSGQALDIFLDASALPRGTYQASIDISSPGALPAVIEVTLVKVDTVYKVFLPIQLP